MHSPPRSLLLIFVKHPVPGQSKTRLAADIGHDQALAVYRSLLAYTAAQVATVPQDKVVFYGNIVPSADLWSEAGYPRHMQSGADLGERMFNAFRWAELMGYSRMVIIGSDCPTLTGAHIEEAFKALETQDAVLGPAEDGGYYLMGIKHPFPSLFLGKTWSTDKVAAQTRADFSKLGWSYTELPTLNDVDTVADLKGTFLEDFAKSDT